MSGHFAILCSTVHPISRIWRYGCFVEGKRLVEIRPLNPPRKNPHRFPSMRFLIPAADGS